MYLQFLKKKKKKTPTKIGRFIVGKRHYLVATENGHPNLTSKKQ